MFRIKQTKCTRGTMFHVQVNPSFIMATIMLIILGLVASEKLHLLAFISTEMIAAIILFFGIVLFLVKLWLWRRDVSEKKL